jgi:MFS family permease
MAVGPVPGGALVHAFGWRSIFWLNPPLLPAGTRIAAGGVLLTPLTADPPPRWGWR